MIITIDGPTASGKTSTARILATNLGYYCINSGLLYRALAYVLLYYKHIPIEQLRMVDESNIVDALSFIKVTPSTDQSCLVIFVDNKEIESSQLKTAEMDKASSMLGLNKNAREKLMHVQRQLAECFQSVVVEGRDVGSVVFPSAKIKFFLTASVAVRAQRWLNDQKKMGKNFSLEEATNFMSERDKQDMQRKISPLIIPQDALVIDNSHYTSIQDSVNAMINVIKEKEGK